MASNEYMKEYMLARYHRRRDEAIELLGGVCVQCGSTDNLELDHIDPLTKTYNYGKLLAGGSKEKVQAELAKAQLLCKSCHELKSIIERGNKPAKGTHGTLSSYRYCRCDKCRAAMNKYNRENKHKWK